MTHLKHSLYNTICELYLNVFFLNREAREENAVPASKNLHQPDALITASLEFIVSSLIPNQRFESSE